MKTIKYISLLRGINVSGHKKIKMADLKTLYEGLGFLNVITYIQSGNVIFEHDNDDISNLKNTVEAAIEKKYNFNVPVDIRAKVEFNDIFDKLPFKNINIEQDGSRILVTFLSDNITKPNFEALNEYVLPTEQLISGKRVLYFHCPNGYGKTKLSNVLIERKLAVITTTRNLKSVAKICQLLDGNST